MSLIKKILLVDDEPDVLFVLRMALEKKGYLVEEANNGMVALEKVESFQPGVIILDLMMPQMDGRTVNLKLKENSATANIPVVIITGKGHLDELMEMRKDLKVTAYLEKPFRVVNLLEKLDEIFSLQN